MLEHHDRVRHILANRRDGRVIGGFRRESAPSRNGIASEPQERRRPSTPKAERLEEGLQVLWFGRGKLIPVWEAGEESLVELGDRRRGRPLQEHFDCDLFIDSRARTSPREDPALLV
jgi:hypothetical protein